MSGDQRASEVVIEGVRYRINDGRVERLVAGNVGGQRSHWLKAKDGPTARKAREQIEGARA